MKASLPVVRGRLAPSPTGRLHLGNAFSFLMAWCGAVGSGGSLVLRIEDIDPDRSRPAFARSIVEDLAWLGLTWDEGPMAQASLIGNSGSQTSLIGNPGSQTSLIGDSGLSPDSPLPEKGNFGPYTQSRRLGLYEKALDDLQARGLIYPCFCTRKELRMLASAPHIGDEGVPYPGTCRSLSKEERARRIARGSRFSLRLNTQAAMDQAFPQAVGSRSAALSFEDAVLGPQSFSLADCGGDFALRRSDGVFSYQLAVTVDDAAMGITQVVRGRDLLLSTPRQIVLLRLFGAPVPVYAHVPLVHDGQGERLAKRHKSLELQALREAGARPEEVVGLLAHLAGFQDSPQPLAANDLLPLFSFADLPERMFYEGVGGSAPKPPAGD